MKKKKIILISGGLDPVHKGHIAYIKEARKHGKVWIALNSDDWLVRKKGYSFMDWEERAEILREIVGVDRVFPVDDTDDTVCAAIQELHDMCIDFAFAKGGDRVETNTPEKTLCEKLGVEIIWNCGGGKIQSSSDLISNVRFLDEGKA